MSVQDAVSLATDPIRVATHAFYPFIRYSLKWNRFAEKGKKGKKKERLIRYAARGDAYIFAYYRELLSHPYESALKSAGLENSVLAYRKIPDAHGNGGKCNIHFARDAFQAIAQFDDCTVVALDISGFFENLDHERLRLLWCRMLGVTKLPDDHYQVFKNITRYSIVEKQRLYERLDYFGLKKTKKSGKSVKGYLTPLNRIPTQLLTGAEFRLKIAGGNGAKTIIEQNKRPYGIPQGAPISDLLANLYLLDFDIVISKWVKSLGGIYYRYSDDIFLVLPGGEQEGRGAMAHVRALIGTFGSKLLIKAEKSSVFVVKKEASRQRVTLVHGEQGKNGIEYLGFRFDGKNVYLRVSTLSGLYRKVQRAARYATNSLARRYPNMDVNELRAEFDFEEFVSKFGRVRNFGERSDEYRNWTFWTYARKASEVLGAVGKPILGQLKDYRRNIRRRVDKEFDRAVANREKQQSNQVLRSAA